VQLNPKTASLFDFLYKEPFANLPADLNKISPDGLTAFYEISFSNANIQKLNLEGRLDDIRNGSNGFSSNMKLNGATVNSENKAGVDGKSSKGIVEPVLQPGPENRWGVWVTGFGDFVNVDSDGNAKGYDFTTGGFSLGINYRITDHLAMGEYSSRSGSSFRSRRFRPVNATVSLRSKVNVPLSVTFPKIVPIAPPLPSCSVPAEMIVPPV
jgi:outer membrane autotransporter protein